MSNRPRILLLDIETFPNVAYVWGKYQQDVIKFVQEGCVAAYAAKWLDEKKVFARGLPNYEGYVPGSYNDKLLIDDLWLLLDEADIVIAHNGDKFDVRIINGRFLAHGRVPPSPFKTVDTLKAVRRVAKFNSNRLDDLGVNLNIGEKIKTSFGLWEGCIKGDAKAWAQMLKYNKQDVLLLEKLYLRLRPFINNHPNFTAETQAMCPKCNSNDVQYRGYAITSTRKYRRFQCKQCGGWGRSVKSEGKSGVTNA